MSGKPTRWGIISVGRISQDFVKVLHILPKSDHTIVAVAARNIESAKGFAESNKIPTFYGSYEDLVNDQNVEVVYIGSVNPQHLPLAKLAFSHGKHVLCEKPLCINLKETKELIDLARESNVFLMEGIWSRCFPLYERLQKELEKETIGEILQVYASLGCPVSEFDNCKLKSLGGGSMLNIGIYCVQLATFVFGKNTRPIKIVAGGHLNFDGIDESISTTLIYENGKTATLISHNRIDLMNDAVIVGTKGMIKIPAMFVCPTKLITPTETVKCDLPKVADGINFNYPNCEGLSYEAEEVRRCIQQGFLESPKMPHSESLLIAEIMETARKQIGVSYDQD